MCAYWYCVSCGIVSLPRVFCTCLCLHLSSHLLSSTSPHHPHTVPTSPPAHLHIRRRQMNVLIGHILVCPVPPILCGWTRHHSVHLPCIHVCLRQNNGSKEGANEEAKEERMFNKPILVMATTLSIPSPTHFMCGLRQRNQSPWSCQFTSTKHH